MPNSLALTVGLVIAAPRGSELLEPIFTGEVITDVTGMAVDKGGGIAGVTNDCSRRGHFFRRR
jgi:hypothetical protein